MKQATAFIVAVSFLFCTNDVKLRAQDEPPKTIKGKLDQNDPPDPFLKKVSMGKRVCPHKIHTIRFAADKVFVINLMSDDFDAFLRIEDGKGNLLAVNDDGGNKLNSLALFTSPKKDNFRVIVSAFDRRPGAYTLSIKPAPGNITFARSGLLLQKSDIQNVKLQKGKSYIINLKSAILPDNNTLQFDTLLKVNDASGKKLAEDDDGGEDLNSRLSFTAPNSATYQIVVTSYEGNEKGFYQLTIEESK